MAFEVDTNGNKETLTYSRSEIDRLAGKKRELQAGNLGLTMDETNVRISELDKQIESVIKKSKAMEEIEKRPGASKLTSIGSVLAGGNTQQSVLTSVLA